MTIKCRYCGQLIELNDDTLEARTAHTDPRQQMRLHLLECRSPDVLTQHAYKLAWLIDLLAFECPEDPARWRANIDQLVDYYQTPEALR